MAIFFKGSHVGRTHGFAVLVVLGDLDPGDPGRMVEDEGRAGRPVYFLSLWGGTWSLKVFVIMRLPCFL